MMHPACVRQHKRGEAMCLECEAELDAWLDARAEEAERVTIQLTLQERVMNGPVKQ